MEQLKWIAAVGLGIILSSAFHNGGLPRFNVESLMSLATSGVAPYRNCAAARAAGAAPVYRGQPGYAPWLDRDNDGIGCE